MRSTLCEEPGVSPDTLVCTVSLPMLSLPKTAIPAGIARSATAEEDLEW
jgi:hypothetical protein